MEYFATYFLPYVKTNAILIFPMFILSNHNSAHHRQTEYISQAFAERYVRYDMKSKTASLRVMAG